MAIQSNYSSRRDSPVSRTAVEVARHRKVMPRSLSYRSLWSVLSASSVLSIASAASLLSIGSFASILSIGSSNSILSIGSDGGFLSFGSSRRSRRRNSSGSSGPSVDVDAGGRAVE